MPVFSIIVPVYKVEHYLQACVDSVMNQPYPDFELILVDDGSPDNCGAICDAYAKKDGRVRVIHKKNGGLSDARNAGLDIATGKYIYFLDGDDAIKPALMETVLPYMELGNDMVVFHYDEKNQKGDEKPVFFHALGTFEIGEETKRKEFILSKLLTGKIGWEAWSRVYSREIIERYHLRFEDNKRIFAEDLYFFLCYCTHARRIVSIPDSLYYYTIREESIMGQERVNPNLDRMVELAKAARRHFEQWDDCKPMLDCFPVVFYLILSHRLEAILGYTHESRRSFPKVVAENLPDRAYFDSQIKKLHHFRKELSLAFSPSEKAQHMSMLRYLKDQNYFLFRLRNRIARELEPFLDRIGCKQNSTRR